MKAASTGSPSLSRSVTARCTAMFSIAAGVAHVAPASDHGEQATMFAGFLVFAGRR